MVRADLPGIDPDKDVELTVAGGMLHIEADIAASCKDGAWRSASRKPKHEEAKKITISKS